MTTEPVRQRYELRVERHLSPATLATFPVPLTTVAVPRNQVRRLLVPADRDLADVVQWLTRRSIQVLEIRRRPAAGTSSSSSCRDRAGLTLLPVPPPDGAPDRADEPGPERPPLGHAAGTMPRRPSRRRLQALSNPPERKDEGP